MIIGFTGSRNPRPLSVVDKFRRYLTTNQNKITEVHHGDCVGWDEQCHNVAQGMGFKIVIHPPENQSHQAGCKAPGCVILPPKPYIERNHDIVDACDFLIAAPDGPEVIRSGTWSTIRYAKKSGVKGVILR